MYKSEDILLKAYKVIKEYDDIAFEAQRNNDFRLSRDYRERQRGYLRALVDAGLIDEKSVDCGTIIYLSVNRLD